METLQKMGVYGPRFWDLYLQGTGRTSHHGNRVSLVGNFHIARLLRNNRLCVKLDYASPAHTIRLDIGVVYNEGFIYGYSLGCCLEDMLTFVEVSYCLWYVPEMRSQV